MKVYSSEICGDCREFKVLMQARGFEAEIVEITENTTNMKAFLKLRDSEDAFEEVRREGRIGIPAFVNDDGAVTLDVNTALGWIGQPPAEAAESGCESCG